MNREIKGATTFHNINAFTDNPANRIRHGNGVFFSRLKYLETIDEPHTFDHFDAIRFVKDAVEQVKASNNGTGPSLFTHYHSK